MSITYRFNAFDGTRTRWATATKMVGYYEGLKSQEFLGIHWMTPELAQRLTEAGSKAMKYSASPSYLRYEGSIVRKTWYGTSHYRGKGRVMVDLRAMKEMDPSYDLFYGSFSDDEDEGPAVALNDNGGEDVARLYSPYLYGFNFLSKTWGEMLCSGMSLIEFRDQAFDQLVLSPARKSLIQALVSQNQKSLGADLIDDKGGGCIFLLHGQPGVGKTLTAEAIAERMHRPLYMVGAGELGVTPDELETRLKSILDIAHSWNAVLLIDEADIFLERRAGSDINRNAMVGIFLRLLEYHQGVLFLTTNRIRDMDEAFMSRISLGLHYESLKSEERAQVWENLLATSHGPKLSEMQRNVLSDLSLNGRQIKHCIRMALAVAGHENREASYRDLSSMADLVLEFKKDFTAS